MSKTVIDPETGIAVGMVISSTEITIKSNPGKEFGEDMFVVIDAQRIPNEAQVFCYARVTVQLMTPDGKPDPNGSTFTFHSPVIHMYNDEIRFEAITLHKKMTQTFI